MIRKIIKKLLVERDTTLVAVAAKLEESLGKKYTAANLSNKLARDTIPFREVEKIAEILNYQIVFVDKNKR